MRIRNIYLAFKDQLPLKRLIRNIIKGHVFGLFSKNSHIRGDTGHLLNRMIKNPPYKIGDIVKIHSGAYVEYLGIDLTRYSNPMVMCRYVKSKHGVPIVCRTRRYINENEFKYTHFCSDKHRWIFEGWLPTIKEEIK